MFRNNSARFNGYSSIVFYIKHYTSNWFRVSPLKYAVEMRVEKNGRCLDSRTLVIVLINTAWWLVCYSASPWFAVCIFHICIIDFSNFYSLHFVI